MSIGLRARADEKVSFRSEGFRVFPVLFRDSLSKDPLGRVCFTAFRSSFRVSPVCESSSLSVEHHPAGEWMSDSKNFLRQHYPKWENSVLQAQGHIHIHISDPEHVTNGGLAMN